MFYIVRTLKASGTRILIANKHAQDADGNPIKSYQFSYREAESLLATIPGDVTIHEFASDAEARMYIDPACVDFRTKHDSKRVALSN